MLLVGDGDTPNYEPLFISIAVIMLLSLAILLWKVDENRFVAERIEIEEAWGIEEEETEVDEKGNAVLPKPVKRSLTFLLLSVAFWYMAYNGVTTAVRERLDGCFDRCADFICAGRHHIQQAGTQEGHFVRRSAACGQLLRSVSV